MKVALLLITFIITSLPSPAPSKKADLVKVYKSERQLVLLHKGKVLKRYHVALGGNPEGHKQQEGDQKTPEGQYTLDYKKLNSAYYKAIKISYPNATDKAQAHKRGVSPGGLIMIHGQKNGFERFQWILQLTDWTHGCIALKNSEMEEVWQAVEVGTPIIINP